MCVVNSKDGEEQYQEVEIEIVHVADLHHVPFLLMHTIYQEHEQHVVYD